LRLAGVHTLAEGNALLPIADYNTRFAKPPANAKDLRRPLRAGDDLEDAFAWKEERTYRKRSDPVARGTSGSNPFAPAESPCLTQTRPLQVENRGFRAGVRRSVGGAVGGDAQAGAISRQGIAISLSGLIPVPQCEQRTVLGFT
jgi:hypothetical protein